MTLKEFFAGHPKAALAYSGGVDSAYLLYAGLACGADIRPYYVKSLFQPEFERRDALRLAEELGVQPVIIELDILSSGDISSNPPDRCYHCKGKIMGGIKAQALKDGYELIIDGTNFSDDAGDRPGMRALREREILSPLRLCGLTKPEIRRLSREAGLFTWDKPAYACLATRVRTGEEITAEKLEKIEQSEELLFAMGFSDFRVRLRGDSALLQFTGEQLRKAQAVFNIIEEKLSKHFKNVLIDSEEREKCL